MANKYYVIALFLLICISCTKDKESKVLSEDNIEIRNIVAVATGESDSIDEVKKTKQDINGNVIFTNKSWSPENKDKASNIQFSGSLVFYNLNVKDTEDITKEKLVDRNFNFENINYLDDGLRTYRVVGLFSEKNILTIGYYNKEFAMCNIENLSLQECQKIANDLLINCDISILEDNEFFEFISDNFEIFFSHYKGKYKFEVYDTLKEP